MHGGDCGSSIWRSGGGPTQRRTWFSGTLICGAGGGGGGGVGVGGRAPGPAALRVGGGPAGPVSPPAVALAVGGAARAGRGLLDDLLRVGRELRRGRRRRS